MTTYLNMGDEWSRLSQDDSAPTLHQLEDFNRLMTILGDPRERAEVSQTRSEAKVVELPASCRF